MLDCIVVVGVGNTGRAMLERLSTIAPVIALDSAAEPLAEVERRFGAPASQREAGRAQRHRVSARLADGTSRIVLEDLRGDPGRRVALVAATGHDRANLEICRLGEVLAFAPVVAVAIDPSRLAEYTALSALATVRAELLTDVVYRALRFEGVAVASNIGLGGGDVVEIRVLASSPIVGRPLAQLGADGWRVAAIYRGDQLVLPTGATEVQTDDRVLLVGPPELLAHVADKLRRGEPNFPWRHGANFAVYLPNGDDPEIEREAQALFERTAAEKLVRVLGTLAAGDGQRVQGGGAYEKAASLLEHHPGLVVMRARPRSWLQRIFGVAGRDAQLCNALPVPVLFAHGDPHFRRVIYVVAAEIADVAGADDAIDLARMLEVPLVVARVNLPHFFGPTDPDVERVVEAVKRLTRLHGLDASVMELEGNPVREVAKLAASDDLVVVNRTRARRDSFAAPDVALRIAHHAPCSVLVVTASRVGQRPSHA